MDERVEFLAERMAANDGKAISQLEDLESLIRAFDGVPLADFEHLIRARTVRGRREAREPAGVRLGAVAMRYEPRR